MVHVRVMVSVHMINKREKKNPQNSKCGAFELSNKTFCFNGVRLSVEYGFFVFDEKHFIN